MSRNKYNRNGSVLSPLTLANAALREGRYLEAIRSYVELMIDMPALGKSIAPNLAIARQRYSASRKTVSRKNVAVCGWELSHNAAGRAYTLATIYNEFANVEIVGSIFPNWGKEIWEPIRDTSIPKHFFIVHDENLFVEQALKLVLAHPYDIVHLSKPRAPNVFFGILYKLVWGSKVLVDVDDEELAFVGKSSSNQGDFTFPSNTIALLDNLPGGEWTRLAVDSLSYFDGTTVSNTELKRKYGGEIIRHARDMRFFLNSNKKRMESRKTFGIPTDKKVVLFFGTPRLHKGILSTAEAIAELKRDDVLFVIAGERPEIEVENELVRILGAHYKYIGKHQIDRAADVVALGDCTVLLQDDGPISEYQVPAKLSDALAMGLHCFVTGNKALSEFIEAGACISATRENLAPQLNKFFNAQWQENEAGKKIFAERLSLSANSEILNTVANQTGVSTDQNTRIFTLAAKLLQHTQLFPLVMSDSSPESLVRVPMLSGTKRGYVQDRLKGTQKIAVVVHAFYEDVMELIVSRLASITVPFELLVTTTHEKLDVIRPLVLEAFPSARFFPFENKGMDIYPFLKLANLMQAERFTIVCKLQTKRGDGPLGTAWRDVMLDSLIGSTANFSAAVSAFEENPKLGMLGPAATYQSSKRLMLDNKASVEWLHETVYRSALQIEDWGFFCGTMFWADVNSLQPLTNALPRCEEMFGGDYKKDGKLEHGIERIFGLIPVVEGMSVGLVHRSVSGDYSIVSVEDPISAIGRADIRDVLSAYSTLKSDISLLRNRSSLDEESYRKKISPALPIDLDLYEHYLLVGSHKNLAPADYFSPAEYRALHKDIVSARVEPFVHYIRSGAREGRALWRDNQKQRLNYYGRYKALSSLFLNWDELERVPRTPEFVSIVIPVYGQPALLEQCIESIFSTKCNRPFEVILVDNKRDEETTLCIEEIARTNRHVKVQSNPFNLNFSLGCNTGFALSRAQYVVFLNSDTTVTDNWLDQLLLPFSRKEIRAVQPKLLYPDGLVQCIGMVLPAWSSLPYQLYNGEAADAKHVNYARPFQVVSAACVAIRASDFAAARGFDEIFVNGWEDVDLCLKLVQDNDGLCWYQPTSVVYHHESKSPGRGAYIDINRRHFINKWQGHVKNDAIGNYARDGIRVTAWRADSEEWLAAGIQMYFPILESSVLNDAEDSRELFSIDPSPFTRVETISAYESDRHDCVIRGNAKALNAPTVLLVSHSASDEIFGSERSFLDVLRALTSLGLNVVVVLPRPCKGDYIDAIANLATEIRIFHYTHWTESQSPSATAINRFTRTIEETSADYVYVNTIMLRESLIAAQHKNVPSLTHVRELIADDAALSSYIGLTPAECIRRITERTDVVIANSEATARMFSDGSKVVQARNIVDSTELDFPNHVNNDCIVFGLISSNIPKKGIYDFVKLAKKCETRTPNAIFSLIGPVNSYIRDILKNSASADFPRNILVRGYIESAKDAVRSVNVILSLSDFSESFGRTVAEGFAARRPAIAYRRGAIPELIENGKSGFLCNPGDIDALSDAVAVFCERPGEISKMGEYGRDYVQDACSLSSLKNSLARALLLANIQSRAKREDSAIRLFKRVENFPVIDAARLISGLSSKVTVVVPVFNALDELRACISALQSSQNDDNIDILLINDGSTDPRVGEFLQKKSKERNVRVVTNPQNLGYTKTINKAIKLSGDNDIVLLNSDTVVTQDWLLALRIAAYSRENIGTVTAMSDNAGAFSFPQAGILNPRIEGLSHDEHAHFILRSVAEISDVELPTGNGFCMYIRHATFAAVGLFDETNFPRGYGEENDFCMRCLNVSLLNLLTPTAYVYHIKSASFKGEREALVQAGMRNLDRLHPTYSSRVREAFGSGAMAGLRHAVSLAVETGKKIAQNTSLTDD